MRFIYFIVTMLMALQVGFAGTKTSIPAKVLVKVELGQQQKQAKANEGHALSNSLQMLVSNHEWMPVARQQSKTTNDLFLVLTKLEKANSKTAKLKFLIVQMEKKGEVISEPEMILSYGQQGKMSIEGSKQQLQLSVLVTKEDAS